MCDHMTHKCMRERRNKGSDSSLKKSTVVLLVCPRFQITHFILLYKSKQLVTLSLSGTYLLPPCMFRFVQQITLRWYRSSQISQERKDEG